MTRVQFLSELYRRLGGLSREQAEQYLTYYAEMLEDRVEEGMTEEEAVASLEDIDTIARRILRDEGVSWQPPRYPDPPRTQNTFHPLQAVEKPAWDWRRPAKIGLWAVAIVVAVLSILNRFNGSVFRAQSSAANNAPDTTIAMVTDTGLLEGTGEVFEEAYIDSDGLYLEGAGEIFKDVYIDSDGLYIHDGDYAVAFNSEGLQVKGADGETQFYIGPNGVEIGGEYSGRWDFGAQG